MKKPFLVVLSALLAVGILSIQPAIGFEGSPLTSDEVLTFQVQDTGLLDGIRAGEEKNGGSGTGVFVLLLAAAFVVVAAAAAASP